MENASKALIIAGGVLLALLVISLLVAGWNRISNYGKIEDEVMTREQIAKFNEQFESYNRVIIRGVDLVSLNNLIEDTNRRYSASEGYKPVTGYITLTKFSSDIATETILNQAVCDSSNYKGLYGARNQPFRYFFGNGIAGVPGPTATNVGGFYTIADSNIKKIFKEAYFTCTEIKYDGDDDPAGGSGRVIELHYKEIKEEE